MGIIEYSTVVPAEYVGELALALFPEAQNEIEALDCISQERYKRIQVLEAQGVSCVNERAQYHLEIACREFLINKKVKEQDEFAGTNRSVAEKIASGSNY